MTQIPHVAVKNKLVPWDWGFCFVSGTVFHPLFSPFSDDHQRLAVPSLREGKTTVLRVFSQHVAVSCDPYGSWDQWGEGRVGEWGCGGSTSARVMPQPIPASEVMLGLVLTLCWNAEHPPGFSAGICPFALGRGFDSCPW